MQAASDLAASGFVVHAAPSLALAGVGQKNIFLAPAQPLAPLAPAGAGQKSFPEPAQLQAPNLSTTALETTPSTPAAQTGLVGVGKYNIPPRLLTLNHFFTAKPRKSVLRRHLLSLRQSRV